MIYKEGLEMIYCERCKTYFNNNSRRIFITLLDKNVRFMTVINRNICRKCYSSKYIKKDIDNNPEQYILVSPDVSFDLGYASDLHPISIKISDGIYDETKEDKRIIHKSVYILKEDIFKFIFRQKTSENKFKKILRVLGFSSGVFGC